MEKEKKAIKKTDVRLPDETYKKIIDMAKADHRSLNSMFIHIIEEYHKKIFTTQ